MSLCASLFLVLLMMNQGPLAQPKTDRLNGCTAVRKPASRRLDVKLVSASSRDAYQNPEAVLDGDPATEFTFVWGNGGAELVLDLREPTVVDFLEIVSGPTGGPFFLNEVNVGPDESHLQRDLLHRGVNLVVVTLPGTSPCILVQRYARGAVRGGGEGRVQGGAIVEEMGSEAGDRRGGARTGSASARRQ